MADFKTTWVFGLADSGWSETWYSTFSTIGLAEDFAVSAAPFRAALMGTPARLLAQRVSDVDIKGDSSFFDFNTVILPYQTLRSDTPWNTWLVRVNAGTLYRRAMHLHGVPDDWIKYDADGSQILPQALAIAVKQFENVVAGNFELRSLVKVPDAGYTLVTGLGADTDGFLTIAVGALTFTVGQTVTMKFWKGPDAKILNGTFTVKKAGVGTCSLSLLAVAVTNPAADFAGKVAIRGIIYPKVTTLELERFAAKRTGRAFFVAAGRRRA